MPNETDKTASDKAASDKAAAELKAKQEASEKAVAAGNAPAVAASQEDNPKVVAPKGTVPTSMAAPGASPPHPSSDKPDVTGDTPEVADARARAAGFDPEAEDEGLPPAPKRGDPIGEPVQCIVKKTFFDERQATIKAGATYYYQRREGETFPLSVLEPVSRTVLAAVKKEADAAEKEKQKARSLKRERREALARLASETE